MLYKKYHRNHVKQFKKGVKIKYPYSYMKLVGGKFYEEVLYYSRCTIDKIDITRFGGIHVFGNISTWTLVFSDGKVNSRIEVEEDVIQEIP